MAADPTASENVPEFLFDLGDVIYNPGEGLYYYEHVSAVLRHNPAAAAVVIGFTR